MTGFATSIPAGALTQCVSTYLTRLECAALIGRVRRGGRLVRREPAATRQEVTR